MLELQTISIAGMHWVDGLLWVAAPEERLIAVYDTASGETERKLTYTHEVWDVCLEQEGLWIVSGGGRLGRQLVLWSLQGARAIRQFNCPDGAGAGVALLDGKIWLAHRRNRKLFCLDPESGKVNWVIRTENETFSPTAYKNELWLIESDPGPLGHWSESRQGKYFFSRYDPVRERIVERLPASFVPRSMAFDGERFWCAEQGQGGVFSIRKSGATMHR